MELKNIYAFTAENGPSKEIINEADIKTLFAFVNLILHVGSEERFNKYVQDANTIIKELTEKKEASGF